MKIKSAMLGAALAFSLAAAGSASALTLGDTVQSDYYFPTNANFYGSGPTFVVAPGFLGTQFVDGNPIDISYATDGVSETWTFLFTPISFSGADFNGIILSDLTGANFGTVTGVTGVPFANAASTGGNLQISWQGLAFNSGDSVSVTLDGGRDGGGLVPEPGTWALMITGFGGMGMMLRRRREGVRAA